MPEPSNEPSNEPAGTGWQPTACILCSINCGIEVQVDDDRHITRIRGDKAHPLSKGYTCQKALRLDHYQNAADRLDTPLRRRPDGTFEPIDWDTAIAEVAQRLGAVRDEHGGERILYYGGGGQGNHLGGAHGSATRKALGIRYTSNALAQEKTGEFWVDGQLFGRTRCHTAGDYEHAEVAVFWGKNPWQSHGFPRARTVLKEIARDPDRRLVVVDPRRTESADLADVHLRVRPGGDAFALAALLAALVDEDLIDHGFLDEHAVGLDAVLAALGGVDVADFARKAGVAEEEIRDLARLLAGASSVAIFEDLGIQQAPHSTLSSYLEKLVVLLVGSFGIEGGMNLHSRFASLGGGGGGGGGGASRTTPVTGHDLVAGFVPCNVIPDEILTDHRDRFRALIVESANPVHSLADSVRMREALDALDVVVVIDVALTETARHADYVLPAASQLEKWEATFFNLEFPRNAFHLRRPVLDPLPGTLPEAEIHTRLVRALGALTDDDLVPLHEAAARGRAAYFDALLSLGATRPDLAGLTPVLLYETLGPTLGPGNQGAAVVAGLAQLCVLEAPDSVRRAGFADGNELFDAVLASPSGVVFTVDDYDETWRRVLHPDGKVHLDVPVLLAELARLTDEDPSVADPEWPFVLAAGERRSFTANTIYRDPSWRKQDTDGALRMHPDDAARLGIVDGGRARVTTRRGAAEVVVELSDTMWPGQASLPNGLGLAYPSAAGDEVVTGVAPNELTSSADRDPFAGTPHHKHVKARIEAVAS
ncbi:MAG: molybdopterin-dependent oxidoreductase [Acidimicrobiales bacterium]